MFEMKKSPITKQIPPNKTNFVVTPANRTFNRIQGNKPDNRIAGNRMARIWPNSKTITARRTCRLCLRHVSLSAIFTPTFRTPRRSFRITETRRGVSAQSIARLGGDMWTGPRARKILTRRRKHELIANRDTTCWHRADTKIVIIINVKPTRTHLNL